MNFAIDNVALSPFLFKTLDLVPGIDDLLPPGIDQAAEAGIDFWEDVRDQNNLQIDS
jgi:hypothetical protein